MPELPEVQTVVDILKNKMPGKTIQSVRSPNGYKGVFENGSLASYRAFLCERQIQSIWRKGKFIIIKLDSGFLLFHLRMTGRFILGIPNKSEYKYISFLGSFLSPEACEFETIIKKWGPDANGTMYLQTALNDVIVIHADYTDWIEATSIVAFYSSKSHNMSLEIESINKEFKTESSYILAGPGRWGSADPWLGIPVGWNQITNVQVIIEIGYEELPVDPSFGSHFFQNLTNLHIGYFTIDNKKDDFIDDAWLKDQSLKKKGEYVDWYQFKNPFKVAIDGLSGSGTITKPIVPAKKIMDEEESSGIKLFDNVTN